MIQERRRHILVHELIGERKRHNEGCDVRGEQRCTSIARGVVPRPVPPSPPFSPLETPSQSSATQDAKAPSGRTAALRIISTLAGIISTAILLSVPRLTIHAEESAVDTGDGQLQRTWRLSELPRHGRHGSTQWVLRGNRVYDITDFIPGHPGGAVILRACGGSIDPYWKIFSIHQKQDVLDILEQYYIGNIDARDLDTNGVVNWAALGPDGGGEIADPFADDPDRDAQLIVHTAKPFNAETPGELLANSFLNPLHLFFVRNHLWVPRIDPSTHTLTIELSNGDEKTYTLADLKARFREHTVTTTLQCAGNRRAHMSSSATGPTSGLQWNIGAIGTADFTGVLLRDVLGDAGYDLDRVYHGPPDDDADPRTDDDMDQHVHFSSPGDTYVASIPLLTALSPASDVLLAYQMNGEPLPRDHGGPLRAIVPGTVAARSVKWLGRVSIDLGEANSQWQRRDYKCFGPNIRAGDVRESDWDDQTSIQELPIQSAITTIKEDEEDKKRVRIQGYAVSGGGRGIIRVDVSTDGGRTWQQAQLHRNRPKGSRQWAWTLWSLTLPKEQLEHPEQEKSLLVVKAVDEAYNTQPEGFESTWNFRGLLGNAWHRVDGKKKDHD